MFHQSIFLLNMGVFLSLWVKDYEVLYVCLACWRSRKSTHMTETMRRLAHCHDTSHKHIVQTSSRQWGRLRYKEFVGTITKGWVFICTVIVIQFFPLYIFPLYFSNKSAQTCGICIVYFCFIYNVKASLRTGLSQVHLQLE